MAELKYIGPNKSGKSQLHAALRGCNVESRLLREYLNAEKGSIVSNRAYQAIVDVLKIRLAIKIVFDGASAQAAFLAKELSSANKSLSVELDTFLTNAKFSGISEGDNWGIPASRFVDINGWCAVAEEVADTLVVETSEALWRNGYFVDTMTFGSSVISCHIQPLDKNSDAVRTKLLQFDKIYQETATLTAVSYPDFLDHVHSMSGLIYDIETFSGDDKSEESEESGKDEEKDEKVGTRVFVPRTLTRQSIDEKFRQRSDVLRRGQSLMGNLAAYFHDFETAELRYAPDKYRVAFEAFGTVHSQLGNGGYLHWMKEGVPEVPAFDLVKERFQQKRVPVMVGAIDRNLPQWEVLAGSAPVSPPFESAVAMLTEFMDVERTGSKLLPARAVCDDYAARLSRIVLLAIHHALAVATEPPDLDWLLCAVRISKIILSAPRSEMVKDGCYAVIRQVAVHLSMRPDLGLSSAYLGSSDESPDDQADDLESLVRLIDMVTKTLSDDFQRACSGKYGKNGARQISEISQPLQAWLMGLARPWFMVAGVPAHVLRSYENSLQCLENVTGLSWAGLPELQ